MDHALSAFAVRSDRPPPAALGLAVLLHGLVVLALWAMSVHAPRLPPVEDVIEVSLEPPPPPPPPKPPPQETAPAPLIEPGLRPPAAITADRPTQALPPAPPLARTPPTPPPPLPRQAMPALPGAPPPAPPPPKPADLPNPVEPAPLPAPPQQALLAPPTPPPPAPRPDLRPSPLTPTPQRRPPAAAQPAEEPSPHPFVNPADAYSRARVADNYLWQVVSRLQGYRYHANVNVSRGVTVVRIVIARDGRLLNVTIARSSGVPEFDRGVLAGVRAGSPYAPLPDSIKGESAAFDLPLVSVAGR